MAIFEPAGPNRWQPTALAAGPFAGLQGGAVASLLTAEVEALAGERQWGTAIASSAWFLRPTPMTVLRTGLSVVAEGGRVSVIDNTLWPDGEDQPCATVRVTLSRERAVEVSGFAEPASNASDPTRFPLRTRRAAHGRPWFMEAMEARAGDGVAWFRMNHAIIDGAASLSKGLLSSTLGPADWTHGIARPFSDVVADPNPNLTVQLFRQPESRWIGIRAEAKWRPAGGLGVGSGVLLDIHGEIGRVSMSVILVPFPHQTKPESAVGLTRAAN
jgi:hypothetical protein